MCKFLLKKVFRIGKNIIHGFYTKYLKPELGESMNITLNTNYNTSLYFTSDRGTENKEVTNPVSSLADGTEGMSASEISGRMYARKKEPEKFNMETSYKYFGEDKYRLVARDGHMYYEKGRFCDVPEYVKAGKTAIKEMGNEDRKNHLNTLSYQNEIADKILSEDALLNNQSIRDSLFEMVTHSNDAVDTDFAGISLRHYIADKTDARLTVLDAYAKSEDLQNNPAIRDNIGPLVLSVKSNDQADLLVSILNENADNNDENYIRLVGLLFRDNIDNREIKEIKTVKDVSRLDKCSAAYLSELEGQKKKVTIDTSHLKFNGITNVVPEISFNSEELVSDYAKKNLHEFLPESLKREEGQLAEVVKDSASTDEVLARYKSHVDDLMYKVKENQGKEAEANFAAACAVNKALKSAFPTDYDAEMERIVKKIDAGEFYFPEVPEDLTDRVNALCFKPEFAATIKKDRTNSVGIPINMVYSNKYHSMLSGNDWDLINTLDRNFYFELMRKYPDKRIRCTSAVDYEIKKDDGGKIVYTHDRDRKNVVRQYASNGAFIYEDAVFNVAEKTYKNKIYYSYEKNPITGEECFYRNKNEGGWQGCEEVTDPEHIKFLAEVKDEIINMDRTLQGIPYSTSKSK